MPLVSALDVLSTAFSLYLVVTIRRMKVKGPEHAVLTASGLLLFAWNALAYILYTSTNAALLRVLLPIACIPAFFFFPIHLHFAYALVRKEGIPTIVLILTYLPPIVFSVFNFFSPVGVELVIGESGYARVRATVGSAANVAWLAYATACFLAPLVVYVRHFWGSKLNRRRKQSALLAWWTAATMMVLLGEYFATAVVPGWNTTSQSPIIMSVWVAALVYAIWRYGFLRLSPALLADEILDSIDDLVLLYGTDGRRVYMNRKAEIVLGAPQALAVHRPGSLTDVDLLGDTVAPMLQRSPNWKPGEPEKQFRIRVPGLTSSVAARPGCGQSWFTLQIRTKPVFDKFKDPLGLLISASVVPTFKDTLQNYELTDREAEILEYLAAGWTISRTAEALSIAERTVKSHVTHIYAKTGATNRVDLVNRVLPGHES